MSSTEARRAPTRRRPLMSWAMMALSLISALLLLDWNDTGVAKPLWFFLLPSVLGLVGTGFALHARRGGWALLSGIWGVAMVPTLLVVVTLFYGP